MSNGDCIFCQIAAGDAPANKIYEDDQVVAVLDINPVNPGHTLIIPKEHSVNILDAKDSTLMAMIAATKTVAKAVLTAFDEYDAFNLESNNGRIAGQIIPHTHWHIVPRKADDGFKHWPGKPYEEGQAEEIADKIKSQI